MTKKLTHHTNSIVLEVNAAKDWVGADNTKFATVFALHHTSRNEDRDPKAIPVSVLFGANTVKLAKATIATGIRFGTTGSLDDAMQTDGRAFSSVRVAALTPLSRRQTAAKKAAAAAGQS